MNPTSKKFISLFLVFSLMMLSANLYAKEKRGAKLIITKKDGQQVQGELITVKPNSLLLLDTEGKDVSVNIADIKAIRVKKKSKILVGFIIFGSLGALLCAASAAANGDDGSPVGAAILGALYFGGGGALTAVIEGAAAGKYKTIRIEGKSDKKIRKAVDKLRKKARIRDYK